MSKSRVPGPVVRAMLRSLLFRTPNGTSCSKSMSCRFCSRLQACASMTWETGLYCPTCKKPLVGTAHRAPDKYLQGCSDLIGLHCLCPDKHEFHILTIPKEDVILASPDPSTKLGPITLLG